MSQELIFYPAAQDEQGVLHPILFTEKGLPAEIFWCNAKERWTDYFKSRPMVIAGELSDAFRQYFFEGDPIRDNEQTYIYKITEEEFSLKGETGGIISGYAPIEMIKEYYASYDKTDYLKYVLEDEIVPAEVFAEFPESERKKYGRFAVLDRFSAEYVCAFLSEVLFSLDASSREGDRCILAFHSF